MRRVSINLSPKLRLDLKLVKRRKSLDETPLLPDLGEVFRARKGNKVSRFFRLIFENKRIKKLLGTNLALIAIATTFVPQNSTINMDNTDTVYAQSPLIVNTQQGVQYPLETIKITQGYRFYHPGIDLDGITGDTVKPILAGKVSYTGYSRFGYGNEVLVNHGNGFESLYAHLSKINVNVGEVVSKSTKLGEVGATGRAFGDHLHLETHQDGKAINPLSILQ